MPSPADWLQFGALGLLGLLLTGGLALASYVTRALIRELERMNAKLDTLSDAFLLLRDPSVRSYLTELRAMSQRPAVSIREIQRDTPIEGRKRF